MEEPKLNPQLKLLVINFLGKCEGNKKQSAIAAGYTESYAKAQAYKLFAREDVKEYMEYIQQLDDIKKGIMSLEEIQVFWSNVINDKECKISARLRASELLAKSQGAFGNEW